MDYEKKYKEAIYLLKELRPKISDYYREKLDGLFPEITESDNEIIRKEIISFLEGFYANKNKDRWIAWLEKQGEQKLAEWSEEDNEILNSILSCVEHCQNEDIEARYNGNRYVDPTRYEPMSDWLKSLKPQNKWKPTEEQMNALNMAYKDRTIQTETLKSLYNDLKKL